MWCCSTALTSSLPSIYSLLLTLVFLSSMTSSIDSAAAAELGETTPLLTTAAGEQQPPAILLVTPQLALEQRLKQHALYATACLGAVCSLTSMILYASFPSVLVNGCIGCLLAVWVVRQQSSLVELEGWKHSIALWDQEADQLTRENEQLKRTLEKAQDKVANLANMEETLAILQSLHGESLDELRQECETMEQYYWNKTTLGDKDSQHQHRHYYYLELLQPIFQMLLTCSDTSADIDNDDNADIILLSDEEIDQLVEKLQNSSSKQVGVDGDAIRQLIIQQGRGFLAVMELIQQVLLQCKREEGEYDNASIRHKDAGCFFLREEPELLISTR